MVIDFFIILAALSQYILTYLLILLMGFNVFKFKARIMLNIEHIVERFELGTLLFIGEMLFACIFKSTNADFIVDIYENSVLGIILCLLIHWHYFHLLDGHGRFFIHRIL